MIGVQDMPTNQSIRDVQMKILEVIKYIDKICRGNGITYYIMGGTALGAVRHGGFIPWDDDLDIFMTPDQYAKFKGAFEKDASKLFIIQEWRTTENYLEYAKVRMNGTTFIEEAFKDRKDLHQGIYVDIMILHKVPKNRLIHKLVYFDSKFVTLYALSLRNWKPKTRGQTIVFKLLKLLPCKLLVKLAYQRIYKYDSMNDNFMYCYWITPAKYRSGLFDASFFSEPVDIPFEDTKLLGSRKIKEYLEYRYGDYMKLPSKDARKVAVHAMVYDTERDYKEFFNEQN